MSRLIPVRLRATLLAGMFCVAAGTAVQTPTSCDTTTTSQHAGGLPVTTSSISGYIIAVG